MQSTRSESIGAVANGNTTAIATARVKVLVFGSNLKGAHGRGAALSARQEWGAVYGSGRGMQAGIGVKGRSFAIPTKGKLLHPLTLMEIQQEVIEFLDYAYEHPELDFLVTRVGCGLARRDEDTMRSMFVNHPPNCYFDSKWGFEKSWGTGVL